MVCYYFPPIATAGTVRSVAFATALARLGWDPVVLTVDRPRDPWLPGPTRDGATVPPGLEIVRAPESNLNAVLELCQGVLSRAAGLFGVDVKTNWFRELLCVPDSQLAWRWVLRGIELARSCDAVYVSCSPFSAALGGALVKLATGKPLVLDFRDAWSLNPHDEHPALHRALARFLDGA